jgi:ubiquinone/menaquinone biosynthesis C-methylase UbiE
LSETIEKEFTRQAAHMASAPAFRAEAVLERLVNALGDASSQRVLDLACGPGIVAEAIAPHVREVVGIDATPAMIRLARERFEKAALENGRFEVAQAEKMPFADGRFNQVVTRLAVHHFTDPGSVLTETRRVLRRGGRLIVADVVSPGNGEQAGLHNALEQLRDPTHVRMFAAQELAALLRSAGFSVLKQDSWEQPRAFKEWAAIVADPRRTAPLEGMMRALARAGQEAGISLREEDGEVRFTHTWLLLIAQRVESGHEVQPA